MEREERREEGPGGYSSSTTPQHHREPHSQSPVEDRTTTPYTPSITSWKECCSPTMFQSYYRILTISFVTRIPYYPVCLLLMYVTSLHYMGRFFPLDVGTDEISPLAAFSLASSISSFFCLSVGVMLSRAFDILLPIAVESGQLHLCWKYLAKGSCILSWTFLPCGVFLWYSGSPLSYLFSMESTWVQGTQWMLRIGIPGYLAFYFIELYQRFSFYHQYPTPYLLAAVISLLSFLTSIGVWIYTHEPQTHSSFPFFTMMSISGSAMLGWASLLLFLWGWRYRLGWQSGMRIVLFQLKHLRRMQRRARQSRVDHENEGEDPMIINEDSAEPLLTQSYGDEEGGESSIILPTSHHLSDPTKGQRRRRRVGTCRPTTTEDLLKDLPDSVRPLVEKSKHSRGGALTPLEAERYASEQDQLKIVSLEQEFGKDGSGFYKRPEEGKKIFLGGLLSAGGVPSREAHSDVACALHPEISIPISPTRLSSESLLNHTTTVREKEALRSLDAEQQGFDTMNSLFSSQVEQMKADTPLNSMDFYPIGSSSTSLNQSQEIPIFTEEESADSSKGLQNFTYGSSSLPEELSPPLHSTNTPSSSQPLQPLASAEEVLPIDMFRSFASSSRSLVWNFITKRHHAPYSRENSSLLPAQNASYASKGVDNEAAPQSLYLARRMLRRASQSATTSPTASQQIVDGVKNESASSLEAQKLQNEMSRPSVPFHRRRKRQTTYFLKRTLTVDNFFSHLFCRECCWPRSLRRSAFRSTGQQCRKTLVNATLFFRIAFHVAFSSLTPLLSWIIISFFFLLQRQPPLSNKERMVDFVAFTVIRYLVEIVLWLALAWENTVSSVLTFHIRAERLEAALFSAAMSLAVGLVQSAFFGLVLFGLFSSSLVDFFSLTHFTTIHDIVRSPLVLFYIILETLRSSLTAMLSSLPDEDIHFYVVLSSSVSFILIQPALTYYFLFRRNWGILGAFASGVWTDCGHTFLLMLLLFLVSAPNAMSMARDGVSIPLMDESVERLLFRFETMGEDTSGLLSCDEPSAAVYHNTDAEHTSTAGQMDNQCFAANYHSLVDDIQEVAYE